MIHVIKVKKLDFILVKTMSYIYLNYICNWYYNHLEIKILGNSNAIIKYNNNNNNSIWYSNNIDRKTKTIAIVHSMFLP